MTRYYAALAEDAIQPEDGAVQDEGDRDGGRRNGAGIGRRRNTAGFALGGHEYQHYSQTDRHQAYEHTTEHTEYLEPAAKSAESDESAEPMPAFGLAFSHQNPDDSSASAAATHPRTSLFPNNSHPAHLALEPPYFSSPSSSSTHRTSRHSYHSSAPLLQTHLRNSRSEPANGHRSEFYDAFLGGYIDLYTPDEPEADPLNEAEMASFNNQYGPPATASNQAPLLQNQHTHQRAPNNDQYDQYAYDSNQQYTNYNSPYRDDHSGSPDLHPGMGHPSRTQNYESSPSGSPSYAQRGQPSYGPYAGAGAGAAAAMPVSRAADDYSQGHGNLARYGALATESEPQRSVGDFRDSPYQNYAHAQSSHASYNSADHLAGAAAPPAMSTPRGTGYNPGYGNGNGNGHGYGHGAYNQYDSAAQYADPHHPQHPYQNPYDNHSISRNNLQGMDYIDPNTIADDGDIGLEYSNPKRRSLISVNRHSVGSRSNPALAVGGAAGVGAAAAHAASGSGETSRGMYGTDMGRSVGAEKSNDIHQFSDIKAEEKKSRKSKKILLIVLAVLLLLGIAGGVVGAIIAKKKSDDASSSPSNGANSGSDSGDMNKNSPSVKKLMNNKNLRKVFMGMAYTPMNTQYPNCLTNKPSQNNVTMDMAILSQLTNVIRLYGTDCGQTELVLTAIDKLGLTDMKVWAGIWLDKNQTTSDRQMSQWWDIVDKFGTKHIKGVAVGNEVLFRQDLTSTQLKTVIADVRTNLTNKNINIPVASSDLGDNWTADLASAVDVVMSNVHPFFGGLPVAQAAAWTWNFWQSHDVILTQGTNKENIISEVGWPSQGGNDCGTGSSGCPDATSGAVAGINQLNTFMNTWVCEALTNGTQYFWFELLDEPWKVVYNTPTQGWEDHWGLFDVNRNLKPGVKIPDCGGKTIPPLS